MILEPQQSDSEFLFNPESGLFLLSEEDLQEDPDPQMPEITDGLGAIFDSGHYAINEEELQLRAGLSVHAGQGDRHWHSITAQMIRASVAFTAQELLRGPPEAPYNGKFLVGEHHLVWDELIARHKRLCLLAARNHGKCGSGDELLLKADGSQVRLDEWKGGDLVVWDDKNRCFDKAYAPPSRPNGKKTIYRIKTKTGRELRLTSEHPLRKWEGWTKAKDLVPGDRIAVAREIKGIGQEHVEDAWLLGLLIGDGGLTGTTTAVTVSDPLLFNELTTIAKRRGWRVVPRQDGITYGLSVSQSAREGTAIGWLRDHGMWGKTAHHKTVPDAIFKAKDEDIAQFLAGYFDADGSVGWCSLEFYSVSKKLLQGIQHLLARLGIISRLNPKNGKYKGKKHRSWRLIIGSKDILRFSEKVILRGKKSIEIVKLLSKQNKNTVMHGGCIDRFPKAIWEEFIRSSHWHSKNGGCQPTPQYESTRDKIQRISDQENNSYVQEWLDAPIFWDEIAEAEELPPVETWALHVPKLNTYLANDIVNHNTFFVDFAYPIWQAINNPMKSGFIFSSTQDQAVRILGDIKEELETNPKLDWLVPKIKEKWGSKLIRCSNGHKIYARGFGTKVRGAHPDWIVVDDGLTDETQYSETVRTKQKDYFKAAITNMINPGGQILVIGTPLHSDDMYAELKKNKEYYFQSFPAESNPDNDAKKPSNKALWPDRFSLDRLGKIKAEIGSILYTREFLCSAVSDEMSLFPMKLFQGNDIEQYNIKLGMPLDYWKEVGVVPYMGVDFAMSSNVQADYTVVWVMGRDRYGNRWIIDIKREKGMPYQQQLSLINTVARKYEPALILLEANQMQRIFGDELIRTSDLPIKKFMTGVQKHSLETGVPGLRVLFENKKVRIPRGDAATVELMDTWIEEMRSFTWIEGKLQSVGGHDDMVMAFWICDQAIRMGGFAFTFGDEYSNDSKSTAQLMKELTGEIQTDEGESEGQSTEDGSDEKESTVNLV